MGVHGAEFSRLGAVLPSSESVGVPDSLAPFYRATPEERKRRIRRVLVQAWAEYRRGEFGLVDSIGFVSQGAAEGEYAKRALRAVLLHLNLGEWESHPARVRADVHRLFRVAIGRLTPHRGGWSVRSRGAA